jgi:hypothetical protein
MANRRHRLREITELALPAERAFVAQSRGDADLGGGMRERIEQVVSDAAARFDSAQELNGYSRERRPASR